MAEIRLYFDETKENDNIVYMKIVKREWQFCLGNDLKSRHLQLFFNILFVQGCLSSRVGKTCYRA